MQDLRTRKNTDNTDMHERMLTLHNLVQNKSLLKSEAALINYVFTVRKILSDPSAFSTKNETVLQRDLESCEVALIDNFEARVVNREALNACKELHKTTYTDFILFDPLPDYQKRTASDPSIKELMARVGM